MLVGGRRSNQNSAGNVQPPVQRYCTVQQPVAFSLSFDLAATPQQACECTNCASTQPCTLASNINRNFQVTQRQLEWPHCAYEGHDKGCRPADLPNPAALTTQCMVTMKSLLGSPMLGLKSAAISRQSVLVSTMSLSDVNADCAYSDFLQSAYML